MRMVIKKIKTYSFWASVCLLFFASQPALAAEKNPGFTLSPFSQEIILEPGRQEAGFSVSIENTTDAEASFHISAVDFSMRDDSGSVTLLEPDSQPRKYGLASWMDFDSERLVLGPGEKKNVNVALKNDSSLAVGGHYGAIVFKMEGAPGSAPVAFQLASLVFARKTGGEEPGMELQWQELQTRFLKDPAGVRLFFQNTGNTHLVPRGIVKIIDFFGREVSAGIINPESAIILPETARSFPVAFQKLSPMFFPGRYTLSVEYRFDGQDGFVTRKTGFNLIPMGSVIVIASVMAVIIAVSPILWRKIKNKNKKAQIKDIQS